MRTKVLAFRTSVLALGLAACGQAAVRSATPAGDVAAAASSAADSVNALGLDLHHLSFTGNANTLISPLSIAAALTMTYAGATGETQREMAATLHLRDGSPAIHSAFRDLLREVEDASAAADYEASVANRLFGQEGLPFKTPFLDTTRDAYDAELATVNFRGASEAARLTINRWVEEQTKDRIKDLLPVGAVGPDTVLALVNTIFFKAAWRSPFPEELSGPSTFLRADGTSIEVPFMSTTGWYRYYADATARVEVLELPYAAGNDSADAAQGASMVIFLPERSSSAAVLSRSLSADTLACLMRSLDASTPEHLMLLLFRQLRLT